jgi:hypothetical protein
LGTQVEPQDVLINVILHNTFQLQMKKLLIDYKDVFAWSYKELKGNSRKICEQKIQFMADAQPIKQRQYKMKPTYALKVRENLYKLLDARFIYPIY